jgi:inosose dehydratase
LGNTACEIWEGPFEDFGGPEVPRRERFPLVARFYEPLLKEAARYRMKVGHHIHMGQLVETEADVDLLVKHMPDMGILLDTGHLAAAGGDSVGVVKKHGSRIVHVHLKDFHKSPEWNPGKPDWRESHFAPLGQGNAGLDISAVLQALADVGYDGWISVELDPQRPLMAKGIRPFEMMRQSREYLRSLGY